MKKKRKNKFNKFTLKWNQWDNERKKWIEEEKRRDEVWNSLMRWKERLEKMK